MSDRRYYRRALLDGPLLAENLLYISQSRFFIMDCYTSRRRKRARLSCVECHRRKVRCDRNDPCRRCSKAKIRCFYDTDDRPRASFSHGRYLASDQVPVRQSSTVTTGIASHALHDTSQSYIATQEIPPSSLGHSPEASVRGTMSKSRLLGTTHPITTYLQVCGLIPVWTHCHVTKEISVMKYTRPIPVFTPRDAEIVRGQHSQWRLKP